MLSGYVAAMRGKVGTDLLFLQAASVLAFDENDLLLLGQSASGNWSTIGGAIEPGERPADAAVREFWEEAGSLISVVKVLGVFGGPEFTATYPNGDQMAYTSIAFEARIISGEPRPDKVEFGKLAWFAPGEVAHLPMTPNNRIVTLGALAGRQQPVHQEPTWRPAS